MKVSLRLSRLAKQAGVSRCSGRIPKTIDDPLVTSLSLEPEISEPPRVQATQKPEQA